MKTDQQKTYYNVLHVLPDAPIEIIRSSYKTLMQALKKHPDLGGNHEEAILINRAYATLSDPEKRSEYDRKLEYQADRDRETIRNQAPDKARDQVEAAAEISLYATGVFTAEDICPFCKALHGRHQIGPDSTCRDCEAPLFRVSTDTRHEHGHPDADWKRAIERIPSDKSIRFLSRWPQSTPDTGRLMDISLNGMKFATDIAVTKNQLLKIDSHLGSSVAKVVYCERDIDETRPKWLVGVEFLTLHFQRSRGAFISTQA